MKFIRFAQWKIDQEGEGVLGFITNHSYLDNPTFRGMRQSLINSFDEVYILDLHGNTLKKEKCPDGSKDENVFDIQQGVAIALFIKKTLLSSPLGKGGMKKGCKVVHSELWGLREKKYEWLNNNDITTTKWKKIAPKSEYYLFIPRDEKLSVGYEKYLKITEIFPANSVGIVTSRDEFVIDFDQDKLRRRILQFREKKLPDEIIQQTYNLKDKSNWNLKDARGRIIKDDNWEQAITKILYRPFDKQWIFYHDAVIERSRKEIMQHMLKENLGLITSRIIKGEAYHHAFATTTMTDASLLATNTASSSYLFPLYLYEQKDKPQKRSFSTMMMLFEPQAEYVTKKPNISPVIIEQLTKEFRKTPSPEEIFYYIYAVLYSEI